MLQNATNALLRFASSCGPILRQQEWACDSASGMLALFFLQMQLFLLQRGKRLRIMDRMDWQTTPNNKIHLARIELATFSVLG